MTLDWDRMKTRNTCTRRAHFLGTSGLPQTPDRNSCHLWMWQPSPENHLHGHFRFATNIWPEQLSSMTGQPCPGNHLHGLFRFAPNIRPQQLSSVTVASAGFFHLSATFLYVEANFFCQVATSAKSNPPNPLLSTFCLRQLLLCASLSLFNILPAHLFHLAGQYHDILCGLRFVLKYL